MKRARGAGSARVGGVFMLEMLVREVRIKTDGHNNNYNTEKRWTRGNEIAAVGRSHFTQNTYHDIESQIYKVKDK